MTAALHAAECRAILGGERDPFAALWNFRASVKDRRLLLAMAGASQFEAVRWRAMAWADLPADARGDIKRGLARFRDWAQRLDEAVL